MPITAARNSNPVNEVSTCPEAITGNDSSRSTPSSPATTVETARIADALAGRHIVFSTPPYPVLGKDELSRADAGTLFIDLASPPYGIDLEAARSLDLRAWREPGLPGRYCPESAAMVLMSHILALRKGGISRD